MPLIYWLLFKNIGQLVLLFRCISLVVRNFRSIIARRAINLFCLPVIQILHFLSQSLPMRGLQHLTNIIKSGIILKNFGWNESTGHKLANCIL